ncbi:glycosyltransferase [Pseudozyma hubeiensis SY62]|uniref:Glycosyltransferase n=1 Tax=Pseudozyma hubeiensis (strain SY62) TaxID=1305764 RepID=R9PC55_PSEHS|nr:glycosyltransferase [Pseudozyma hubeiensis SY62]GAC98924.1 glycosyltransferase [Pseudozyma hubeiensis SY62]
MCALVRFELKTFLRRFFREEAESDPAETRKRTNADPFFHLVTSISIRLIRCYRQRTADLSLVWFRINAVDSAASDDVVLQADSADLYRPSDVCILRSCSAQLLPKRQTADPDAVPQLPVKIQKDSAADKHNNKKKARR